MMYNAVIPDYDSASSEGGGTSSTTDSKKVSGSISLFEIGQRVMEGKGV